jgi:hypothetical protein
MLVFTIFGSVNDTDTFFCEALANVSLNYVIIQSRLTICSMYRKFAL